MRFQEFGYFKEYFQNGKFIGQQVCEKDRDVLGWFGRQNHIAESNITLGKKTIKLGTQYETYLQKLCGKVDRTEIKQ